MATWPPTLAQLKLDMGVTRDDKDAALQQALDAAVAYVERVRSDLDFSAPVTDDLVLGTLRYARRLDYRRESPGGAIVSMEAGASPVASWDADVEKLLRIGRYGRLRFA